MKTTLKLFAISITAILIVSCAPRELTSNGRNVYMSKNIPPKSCRLLGYIRNPNVHKDLDLRYTDRDKQKNYINYIKNEGAKLHANVVVITSLKKFDIKRTYVRSASYFIIEGHDITANAYLCPQNIMVSLSNG